MPPVWRSTPGGAGGTPWAARPDWQPAGPARAGASAPAPDGGAYRAPQTHGDLQRAGLRLAEQLKQAEREHPGREVDLIAHSQGGVVVDVFLQDYYDAADPAYPPIGTIVTLSSPHEGAPLATAAADWRAR